jgi:hypothetical protein
MPRYRRLRLSKQDSGKAAAASVLVGAGVAAVTFYVMRLLLSRDPISPTELEAGARPSLLSSGSSPSAARSAAEEAEAGED